MAPSSRLLAALSRSLQDVLSVLLPPACCVCDKIRDEYKTPMKIIGTGGLASLFAQGALLFDVIEDDLTMHGLTVIHAYNKKVHAT